VKHSIALAALVVTSIGLSALPVAAQDQTTPVAQKSDREIHRTLRGAGPGRGGPMGGAGLLGLVCAPQGAEALEISFVRLANRLDLTDEQKPLFDAYKTSALTAQTSFADECATAVPDATAAGDTDLIDRLKSRLTLEQTRLTAMNGLLPDFEAFYGSLTDAQKADLMPQRQVFRGDRFGRDDHNDRGGPGRQFRQQAPGR
jgi:hypothetical protein